jgi:hypothetical protein
MGVKQDYPIDRNSDTRREKEEGNTKRRDKRKEKEMCLQFEGNREKSKSKRDGNGKTVRQVKKYNTRIECKVKGERKGCRCECNAIVHPKMNRIQTQSKLIFQYRSSFLLFFWPVQD